MTKKEYIYSAKVLNVVDGDTMDLEIDLGFYVVIRERIRLSGLDTAELKSQDPVLQKLAQDAKALSLTYLGKQVILKSFKKDKYGRFLAEVFLEGDSHSLNSKLLSSKLAKPYDGGARG